MSKGRITAKSLIAMALVALVASLSGCPKGKEGDKGEEPGKAEAQAGAQTVSEKAKVEFFVMSQCPFGLQVENGIAPVLAKMGPDIDFSLDFIGKIKVEKDKDDELTSMHGQSEVDGNKVQLCAAKHDPDKYFEMILCMNKNMKAIPGNWQACAQQHGLDVDKIKTCFEGVEGNTLVRASFEKAQKRRARGSPTIYIGGKPYRGPRSEMAFTRAICGAFPKEKPKPCADLPPPVKVPVTIVTDKRCRQCRAKFWEGRMKSMFPGAEVAILEYADPQGKKLYDELQLKLLPAILFGKEVEKADNYARVRRFLTPMGDYLSFRSGAKFDPTKEVCDNGIDDTGNGKIDCGDPDCKNNMVCRKEIANKLDVFVMSQCPYGTRALDAMKEVLDNFNNKIDFDIHFVGNIQGDKPTSMHGQPEVDEDIREICAIKHYSKKYKYMDYILCRNKNIRSPDWQACTGANGISAAKIEKCFKGEGEKLLLKDFEIALGLGFSASPTWLANNKLKFSGVDAETIKNKMCQHNKGLPNCDKKLSGPPPRKGGGGDTCGK